MRTRVIFPLYWLCCGPTRGVFLPTPSAGAQLHQHHDRLAAWGSGCRFQRVRILRRAARMLLALWSKDRPPTQHARRAMGTWRGCVVGQRGARSSPRCRPGLNRTNTATGQRHEVRCVVGTVFESRGARPACFRPVEYRPTAHGAHAAQSDLGVVVLWANAGRTPPHAFGRGATAPTPRQFARWHGLPKLVVTAFASRVARPARFSSRGVPADRLRSTRAAQCGLGVVVL